MWKDMASKYKGGFVDLPSEPVTLTEFKALIDSFIANECQRGSGHLTHKKCGSAIRTGFANLFYLNEDGSLDPGTDGFGIGPKKVPYCEKCDPPDGFKFTYARRVAIKHDPDEKPRPAPEVTVDDLEWLLGRGRYGQ